MMKSGYSPLLDMEIKRILFSNYIFLGFSLFVCRSLMAIPILFYNTFDLCHRRWTG